MVSLMKEVPSKTPIYPAVAIASLPSGKGSKALTRLSGSPWRMSISTIGSDGGVSCAAIDAEHKTNIINDRMIFMATP